MMITSKVPKEEILSLLATQKKKRGGHAEQATSLESYMHDKRLKDIVVKKRGFTHTARIPWAYVKLCEKHRNWVPDGGVYYKGGVPVLVVEGKYNKLRGNAVQRFYSPASDLIETYAGIKILVFLAGPGAALPYIYEYLTCHAYAIKGYVTVVKQVEPFTESQVRMHISDMLERLK